MSRNEIYLPKINDPTLIGYYGIYKDGILIYEGTDPLPFLKDRHDSEMGERQIKINLVSDDAITFDGHTIRIPYKDEDSLSLRDCQILSQHGVKWHITKQSKNRSVLGWLFYLIGRS